MVVRQVTIGVVLKVEKRTPQDASRLTELARSMGFEPAGKGLATMSMRASTETFNRVFGATAKPVSPQPPSGSDAGAPGGTIAEAELPVPNEWREFVEAVSVAPPARRL